MADNLIGGVGSLKVDGRQLSVRATFTINPSLENRSAVGGPDGTHGYVVENNTPYIEAEISVRPNFFNLEELREVRNSTVVAQLGTGETWTLRNAWQSGTLDYNALDGTCTARFEGLDCYRS